MKYKLIVPEYTKVIQQLLNTSSSINVIYLKDDLQFLEKVGVLNLWYKPVDIKEQMLECLSQWEETYNIKKLVNFNCFGYSAAEENLIDDLLKIIEK
jgi:hypothetical protein